MTGQPRLACHAIGVVAGLARMRESNPWGKLFHDQWAIIFEKPLEEVIEAMKDPSLEIYDLRQETPFIGLIDRQERTRALKEFERLYPPDESQP